MTVKFFEGLLILVFGVGLYSVFTERNLVKIVMGSNIMKTAVILLLASREYASELQPAASLPNGAYVEPVPQGLLQLALMIAAATCFGETL